MSGENEDDVFLLTKTLTGETRKLSEQYKTAFVSLKAMKSPVKKVENKFRYQIMMKIKPEFEDEVIPLIYDITNKNKLKGVLVFVEQNPQNLN